VDWQAETVLWRYRNPDKSFPFYSSAAATDKIVVIGSRDKILHALNPASGARLWTFSTRSAIDPSPVIAGDRVYVASGNGDLFALDLDTGKELWRYEIAAPVTASPAVGDGHLVIGTSAGAVLAFGPRAGGAPEKGSG